MTKIENKQKSSNEFKVLNLSKHIREIGINILRSESGQQTENVCEKDENYFSGQLEVSNSPNRNSFYTSKFQYAHGLINSKNQNDVQPGIKLLTELLREHSSDIHAQRDYGKYKKERNKIFVDSSIFYCCWILSLERLRKSYFKIGKNFKNRAR